eukprot:scaffold10364_cov61-Attheya_sp.AAC.11
MERATHYCEKRAIHSEAFSQRLDGPCQFQCDHHACPNESDVGTPTMPVVAAANTITAGAPDAECKEFYEDLGLSWNARERRMMRQLLALAYHGFPPALLYRPPSD